MDKKILEHAPVVTPKKDKHHITEATPFNFKTDERLKSQMSIDREESENSSAVPAFKARPMPNYKFFEVKHNHD